MDYSTRRSADERRSAGTRDSNQRLKPSFEAGPETLGRFAEAVENYEGTVQRLGKLGRSARHAHPWFGPMTAHEWHCLAGIHRGAHRQQIERIKEGLSLQAG
jgi:hypothetical protein